MIANDFSSRRRHVIDAFDHMHEHAGWWREARMRLSWEPIRSLPLDLGDLALADPVVLRSANQWVLGHWYDGSWVKVTEGGSWPLNHFRPLQWAVPTVDDHVRLVQE